MQNLHKLFQNNLNQDSLLKKLDIQQNDKNSLSDARKKIRAHLRSGVAKITEKMMGKNKKVFPKFFTQGSWSYKTLNDPAIEPPQEIDLDDGVYLPMSLINESPPTTACNAFFQIMDSLLAELVLKNKEWELVKDKKTCCRIKINNKSHVDLPLYAIPDDEFIALSEKAALRGYGSITEAAMIFDSYDWLQLPSDKIWLAIRDGNWEQSDPRKVDSWVKQQKNIFGQQYIDICRYLKAWRDNQWETDGPSSILLMVCISQSFEKNQNRDDLTLLKVAEKLVIQLINEVSAPFIETDKSLNHLQGEERKLASKKAEKLYVSLNKAVYETSDKDVVLDLVANEFGSRIPRDHPLIVTYSAADVVRSYPKKVVPAPAIKKVKAG